MTDIETTLLIPAPSPATSQPTEVPDEALVRSFVSGDASAYRTLVLRYARRLIAYATRLTGDAGAAEDVTQEVFLRLYTKARELRADDRLRPWLYAIARNASLDLIRRRRRAPSPLPPAPALACARSRPDERVEQAELRERVEAALARLTEDQQAAFVLCVLDDLSYEDASRVLGCTVKTLSSRLARARERFREQFREGEP